MPPPHSGQLRRPGPPVACAREGAPPVEGLAGAIADALDPIAVVDAAGRILSFNEAAEALFDIAPARARESDFCLLVPPRARATCAAAFAGFVERGDRRLKLQGPRLRACRGDGTEFPFEASVSRFQEAGEPRFLFLFRDLTVEVLAREQLERSLSVMQATLDATTDGILVTALDGRIIGRNDRFLEMWRLNRSPVLVDDANARLPAILAQLRDPSRFAARAAEIFAHPDDESFDVLELLDGRVFERHSRPQRLEGRSVGRVWSFRDVTERHRAQQELAHSEASFRAFVEHSPYAIYRAARDGRLIAANPAMVHLLGHDDVEAVLGLNLGRDVYVHDGDERPVLAWERPEGLETRWRRRDGSVIWVRISGLVVQDEAAGVDYFEGFVADITPLRDAERARRQAEKLAAVGQLVSGVAHELNNPLSAILSFAEDLLQDERAPGDAEALGMIHAQAQRSRAIVRDLLSFVRSREGERGAVGVDDLVEVVLRSLRGEAQRLGVRLETAREGEPAVVVAERAGLEQVLTNLVMNAAQAAGAGGAVTVRVRGAAAPAHCAIVVEDTGPGIPETVMPRIFDPFFTTKPTGTGTGLGLSVSLGIVEQHGGTLTAANREGGGARFTVTLPRAEGRDAVLPPPMPRTPTPAVHTPAVPPDERPAASAPAVTARPAPGPEMSDDAHKPRALVIDDEATIRAALRRFFTRRGWIVDEAEDGRVALARLLAPDAPTYTAVISDLRMPGLSGMELHDRLAEERPALLERLVFSTGDVVSPEAADFVKRTRCPVLQKPFELSRLVEILQSVSS